MAGSPRPGPGSVAGGVTARTRWRAPYSSQQRAALGRRLGACLLAPEVHSHPEASSPSLGPLRGQGCQGCSPKPSQTPDPRAQSHQLHRNPDVPAQTRAFPEGMRDPARATCQHLRGRGVGLLQPGWGWGRQPRRAHAPHATHQPHTWEGLGRVAKAVVRCLPLWCHRQLGGLEAPCAPGPAKGCTPGAEPHVLGVSGAGLGTLGALHSCDCRA